MARANGRDFTFGSTLNLIKTTLINKERERAIFYKICPLKPIFPQDSLSSILSSLPHFFHTFASKLLIKLKEKDVIKNENTTKDGERGNLPESEAR